MDFQIYTGNRIEILARHLADIVRQPLESAFCPEIIIIQSSGMEKWISTAIAEHNGVFANCEFPFPNSFVQHTFGNILKNLPEHSLFNEETICFKIMKMLPECLERSEFKSLKKYLINDTNGLKLFQLSSKISDLFDQYLIFRPEMIMRWEAGKENHWQALLWRRLCSGVKELHQARLSEEIFKRIREKKADGKNLPSRVSVFGISYLPPFYIRTFSALSELMQINFFLVNPCMEYWADIVSDEQISRLRKKDFAGAPDSEALHLDQGNRLLASMGSVGKDFFSIINESEIDIIDCFADEPGSTALSRIQSDILNLTESKHLSGSDREMSALFTDDDDSVQIHSCHSRMRETEILHDNLLAMFEADPDLCPKDIIVMAPDINEYASFIQAVFQPHKGNSQSIPFSIADRSIQKQSHVISAFFSILDLKESRLGVNEVMELLDLWVVRERFSIDEHEIQIIWQWVEDARIRWGVDGKARVNLGLPWSDENTWQAGIQRLLLGYAMPGSVNKMFSGILPYSNIEGIQVQILGNFLEFLERVFESVKMLNEAKTFSGWRGTLLKIIDRFIIPLDDLHPEIHNLKTVLDDLVKKGEIADFDERVALEPVKLYLDNHFNYKRFGPGFISSGVTFCAMLPMRSIPAKVVCVLGMNNDCFPRDKARPGFDLMAQSPKPGDRSKRNDDKYLFLEAIISARSKLYISFTGTDIQNNIQVPPSVLVCELIDYISECFLIPENKIVTYHPLHGFSPEYFEPEEIKEHKRLFSYSQENAEAAKCLTGPKKKTGFLSCGLPQASTDLKDISLDELCSFFSNPSKFLLEHRFGIYLRKTSAVPDDRETFNPDNLERYGIGEQLVKSRLSGSEIKEIFPVQRAMGNLPHGSAGHVFFNQTGNDVEVFAGKIKKYICSGQLTPLTVNLNIADVSLTGSLTSLYEKGRIQYRYAKINPKDILHAWINHIVFCAVNNSGNEKTFLIGRDLAWEFKAVPESKVILNELVSYFRQGMAEPLKFFPVSSHEYANQVINKNKSTDAAMYAARKKWRGTEYDPITPESRELNYNRWFSNSDPIDEEFQKIAVNIFVPIFSHIVRDPGADNA